MVSPETDNSSERQARRDSLSPDSASRYNLPLNFQQMFHYSIKFTSIGDAVIPELIYLQIEIQSAM